MANICKRAYLIFLTALFFIIYSSCTGYGSTQIIRYDRYDNNATGSNEYLFTVGNNSSIGARINPGNNSGLCYSPRENANLVEMSQDEFASIFRSAPHEYETLADLERYADNGFRIHARTLHCYKNFMRWLQKRISGDKDFRVQGFKYSFSLWGSTKNEFLDFVDSEVRQIQQDEVNEANRIANEQAAARIRQQQSLPRLYISAQQELEWHIDNCTERAAIAYQTGDNEFSSRLAARAKALTLAGEQSGACTDYSSQVQHPTFTDPFADVFDNCYGSVIDKQLHEELCTTRTKMSELYSNHPNIMQVNTIYPVVYHFTALAKVQTNPSVAYNLSDFCYHLTRVAQGFGNASVVVLRGTGKGLVNIVDHNVALCQLIATHPVNEVLVPLCQAGVALGKAVFCAAALAVNDPDKFDQHAYNIAINLGRYARDNPEEAIAGVVEFLIPLKAGSLVKLKQVQAIVKAVQEQEQFVRTMQFVSNVSTKITTPLKEILADASAIVCVGLEHGKEAIQNLIKVVQRQPEITSVGDVAALKVSSECFNNFEKLSKEVTTHGSKIGCTWQAKDFAAEKLQKHFDKHVLKMAEWGTNSSMTINDYLNKARQLLNSQIIGDIDGFVSKEGWVFRYNRATNEFAVAKPDGVIETLFRPKEGISYWKTQIEKYRQ